MLKLDFFNLFLITALSLASTSAIGADKPRPQNPLSRAPAGVGTPDIGIATFFSQIKGSVKFEYQCNPDKIEFIHPKPEGKLDSKTNKKDERSERNSEKLQEDKVRDICLIRTIDETNGTICYGVSTSNPANQIFFSCTRLK